MAAFLTVQVLSTEGLDLEYVAEILDWIFLILPHYCLSSGIRNMHTVYATYNLCETLVNTCVTTGHQDNITCWLIACDFQAQCCG